jgi:hypothetical protein
LQVRLGLGGSFRLRGNAVAARFGVSVGHGRLFFALPKGAFPAAKRHRQPGSPPFGRPCAPQKARTHAPTRMGRGAALAARLLSTAPRGGHSPRRRAFLCSGHCCLSGGGAKDRWSITAASGRRAVRLFLSVRPLQGASFFRTGGAWAPLYFVPAGHGRSFLSVRQRHGRPNLAVRLGVDGPFCQCGGAWRALAVGGEVLGRHDFSVRWGLGSSFWRCGNAMAAQLGGTVGHGRLLPSVRQR